MPTPLTPPASCKLFGTQEKKTSSIFVHPTWPCYTSNKTREARKMQDLQETGTSEAISQVNDRAGIRELQIIKGQLLQRKLAPREKN